MRLRERSDSWSSLSKILLPKNPKVQCVRDSGQTRVRILAAKAEMGRELQ